MDCTIVNAANKKDVFPDIRLYMELKTRLRIAQFYLIFPADTFNCRNMKVDFFQDKICIQTMENESSGPCYEFSLGPAYVLPATCNGLSLSEHSELHWRMQLLTDGDGGLDLDPDPDTNLTSQGQSTADQMVDVLKSSSGPCCCSMCGEKLLQKMKFHRVLPLPSEGWADFADSWFCHTHTHEHGASNSCHGNGTESNKLGDSPSENDNASKCQTDDIHHGNKHHGNKEAIDLLKKAPFCPKEDDCFVGDTYCLIHPCQISRETVERKNQSNLLNCRRCHNQIGEMMGTHLDDHLAVKVFLHAVSLKPHGNKPERVKSTEVSLTQYMLNLSNRYTSFRFIIEHRQPADKPKPYLLFWILDQCAQVALSSIGGSRSQKVKVHPDLMVKVLYQYCGDKPTNSTVSTWLQDNTVQCVDLPKSSCFSLFSSLVSSTKILPQSLRMANDFYVGYLKR
ncbi:E3 ubiquitin-protein ligase E3D [Lingula anatina]|uniref:E3 ubiquitin-protein ligase E3D n=1 Tax=Lingula anatina TaxID=7574 RepID=A0A1S3ITU7_LINAN|nr:E3 ubiquitin-protein ligase E3D [Lingula anatina]|eukprot:XP_013401630.1 E3 ubiquitin-protein ligase E3D [Lingula anatina]